MKGLVIKSTGSSYKVLEEQTNTIFNCSIKGHFRTQGIKATNPISVGDFVDFETIDMASKSGVIYKIYDRFNYIVRKSINLSKQYHIIASNIDQLVLVVTLKSPFTSTLFIDRYLLTAEAYGIQSSIVFNKIDLLDPLELETLDALASIYANIGYSVVQTSIHKKMNVEALKDLFKNKKSLIAGNSGVGKSSLMNFIQPGLQIQTADISDSHQRGKHTTTFAEMHRLDIGGFIIDSPGIKSFSIVDMNQAEYYKYFPEIFKASKACKFHNCLHIKEPNCNVIALVNSGEINIGRYHNYLNIYNSDPSSYRKEP